jgi:hypothetical protein
MVLPIRTKAAADIERPGPALAWKQAYRRSQSQLCSFKEWLSRSHFDPSSNRGFEEVHNLVDFRVVLC